MERMHAPCINVMPTQGENYKRKRAENGQSCLCHVWGEEQGQLGHTPEEVVVYGRE